MPAELRVAALKGGARRGFREGRGEERSGAVRRGVSLEASNLSFRSAYYCDDLNSGDSCADQKLVAIECPDALWLSLSRRTQLVNLTLFVDEFLPEGSLPAAQTMATAHRAAPPASDGSRTVTVTPTPTPDDHAPEAGPSTGTVGTLRLRARAMPGTRVQWSEETVDNEGLNRKKSKSAPNMTSLGTALLRALIHVTLCFPQSAASTTNRKSLTNPRTSPTRAATAAATADLETVDKAAVAETLRGDTTTTTTITEKSARADPHQGDPLHGGRRTEPRWCRLKRRRPRWQDRNRMPMNDNRRRHIILAVAVAKEKEKVRAGFHRNRAANERKREGDPSRFSSVCLHVD